jgi:hypothetical protein
LVALLKTSKSSILNWQKMHGPVVFGANGFSLIMDTL